MNRILPMCFLLFASACSNLVADADNMAAAGGLRRTEVKASPFILTAYTKISDKSQPYNVYIEGDGLAWVSRTQPSENPTPRRALALALASLDVSPNVLYIARPCQFTPLEIDHKCDVSYWTDKRFSEEVVSSTNKAIDKLVGEVDGHKINLIGYSGGGNVVVLLAARRSDVATIRTVAGNLDHVELHKINEVSQLAGSLNAIDYAKKVSSVPQIHYSGDEDEIVSPKIAQKFVKHSGNPACVKSKIVKGASHEGGWKEKWREFLKTVPKCDNG